MSRKSETTAQNNKTVPILPETPVFDRFKAHYFNKKVF